MNGPIVRRIHLMLLIGRPICVKTLITPKFSFLRSARTNAPHSGSFFYARINPPPLPQVLLLVRDQTDRQTDVAPAYTQAADTGSTARIGGLSITSASPFDVLHMSDRLYPPASSAVIEKPRIEVERHVLIHLTHTYTHMYISDHVSVKVTICNTKIFFIREISLAEVGKYQQSDSECESPITVRIQCSPIDIFPQEANVFGPYVVK